MLISSRYAWDIGRSQPAIARLAARGVFAGEVLDAGCGTGEHTLLITSLGLPRGITNSPLYVKGLLPGSIGQFEYDAIHDRLLAVSWIIPTHAESEHPDAMPADGAAFIAGKIDAIAANPDVWAKTSVATTLRT
jgi:hypothetical protein